jgi:transposase
MRHRDRDSDSRDCPTANPAPNVSQLVASCWLAVDAGDIKWDKARQRLSIERTTYSSPDTRDRTSDRDSAAAHTLTVAPSTCWCPSLFAALDIASGFVIGKCYERHRAAEFLDFFKQIDAQVPPEIHVHIIMDNYATHKTALVRSWLARRPHYHVHFTPTSASWINQVERWFAELTRKQLQRGVHTSTKQLEDDIRTFIERHNENPKPYRWTKSADDILASVKRFCQTAERTLCGEF